MYGLFRILFGVALQKLRIYNLPKFELAVVSIEQEIN